MFLNATERFKQEKGYLIDIIFAVIVFSIDLFRAALYRLMLMLHKDALFHYNITEVTSNKSSLLLRIILQKTQTLRFCTMNIKHKLFTKVTKNANQFGLG